jgi:hypothetical protein
MYPISICLNVLAVPEGFLFDRKGGSIVLNDYYYLVNGNSLLRKEKQGCM